MDPARLALIKFASHGSYTDELIAEIERLQVTERELEDLRGRLRELFGLDYEEGIKEFEEAMKQV